MANQRDNLHAHSVGHVTRRDFLKIAGGGSLALTLGGGALAAPFVQSGRKPSFLYLMTDQQGLDTLSAYGCSHVQTPNMDRLAARGMSFMESYCTYPVCGPARSSLHTGRMPSETGVDVNGKEIREDMPNLGQWLRREGYDTAHIGKWHLPRSWQRYMPGYNVVSAGQNGQGTLAGTTVARASEAWLHNRSRSARPFLLVSSFLQPHDICEFIRMNRNTTELPFPEIADELPPMPFNFGYDPLEPARVKGRRAAQVVTLEGRKGLENWSETMWRYYLWAYYRMIEEVDSEVGRVLVALEESGHGENTVIVFTADHGEACGAHQLTVKSTFFEEEAKVPMIVVAPDGAGAGVRDRKRLISGLDPMPTFCDYAGVKPPEGNRGLSMRPFLEGRTGPSHELVMAETGTGCRGRMIRTADYKYVEYLGDPVTQLFNLKNDPGELKNLSEDRAAVRDEHAKLLRDYEGALERVVGVS
ncbi:sulfatase-like hydrolase/transferase [bacterium]|nr:sulfatase-like hydrolase/transferase [bacterium]